MSDYLASLILGVAMVVGLSGITGSRAQVSTALSAPVVEHASGVSMRVARLDLNRYQGRVEVTLMAWNGTAFITTTKPVEALYDSTTTPTGASLIISLNKANLSTAGNSLEARVLAQLITNGYITGTTSGIPE